MVKGFAAEYERKKLNSAYLDSTPIYQAGGRYLAVLQAWRNTVVLVLSGWMIAQSDAKPLTILHICCSPLHHEHSGTETFQKGLSGLFALEIETQPDIAMRLMPHDIQIAGDIIYQDRLIFLQQR